MRNVCTLPPIILSSMYECAVKLIKKGKAYVCDLSAGGDQASTEETLTEPGKNSPYRDRSVEENLKLCLRR